MKKRLLSPTFDASAKTVVHASFSDVGLAGIQLITNVTDNVIIYNFADPALGGTLSTDTLTLTYDTTSMADTDELMVLVEDGSAEVQVDVVTMPTTTVQATDLDIRPLVNTDVVTAELSAVDNAVLDAIETATEATQAALETAGGLVVNLGANNDVTVTGTVDLGATDNAVLDAIAASVAAADTDLTTIIGHVDGLETLVGTTNTTLGTIDADTGNIVTSVQLIDDMIYTAGTDTYSEATSKGGLLLAVRRDADTTLANTTNEMVPLQVDAAGKLKVEAFSGETLPVSLASVPSHAVTNAGTFAVQVDGSALTALQLIDNSIYVDDADWTADTSSHTLVGAVTQATPSANTDGDTTPLITNAHRELRVAYPESDLATAATKHVKKYYTNAGAVTDGIIWSPAAGTRWYVTSLFINVSAAATVTLEDDLAGGDSAIWKAELAANSGVHMSFPTPWFSGEDAADLIITTTAGNVYVTAVGYEI